MSDPYFDDLLARFSHAGPWPTTDGPPMDRAESRMTTGLAHMAHSAHAKTEKIRSDIGPAHEIEGIIEVLTMEVGRHLGPELTALIRQVMHPMDRASRADLAAAIDDAFSSTCNLDDARQQAADATQASKISTPGPALDWLSWIAERCALVREDHIHITKGLRRVHPRLQQRLAERYAEAWREAADAEPLPHRKDNAGRCAANLIITRLNTWGEAHDTHIEC